MKTDMFDRIEAIRYPCLILLPFIKTKYVEFTNSEMKIKAMYLPQTPITQ